jgi:hypothetical protein
MIERNTQQARAGALNLHGLLARWSKVATEAWVTALLGWEEQERAPPQPGAPAAYRSHRPL